MGDKKGEVVLDGTALISMFGSGPRNGGPQEDMREVIVGVLEGMESGVMVEDDSREGDHMFTESAAFGMYSTKQQALEALMEAVRGLMRRAVPGSEAQELLGECAASLVCGQVPRLQESQRSSLEEGEECRSEEELLTDAVVVNEAEAGGVLPVGPRELPSMDATKEGEVAYTTEQLFEAMMALDRV